jgi:hypothetical protein
MTEANSFDSCENSSDHNEDQQAAEDHSKIEYEVLEWNVFNGANYSIYACILYNHSN